MGETFAFSQSDGKELSTSDLENIAYRIGTISRLSFCRSCGLMRSGPGALLGFSP